MKMKSKNKMKRFVIIILQLLSFTFGVNAQPVSKPVLSETAARLYLQYFTKILTLD